MEPSAPRGEEDHADVDYELTRMQNSLRHMIADMTTMMQMTGPEASVTRADRREYISNALLRKKLVIKPGEGPLSFGDKHGGDGECGDCCAICLVEYQNGDEISWSHNSSCGHAFHLDCIIEWLLTSDECPCCRRNFLLFSNEDESDEVRDEISPPFVRDQESRLDRRLQLSSQPIHPPLPTLRTAASDVENSSGRNSRAGSNFGRCASG